MNCQEVAFHLFLPTCYRKNLHVVFLFYFFDINIRKEHKKLNNLYYEKNLLFFFLMKYFDSIQKK